MRRWEPRRASAWSSLVRLWWRLRRSLAIVLLLMAGALLIYVLGRELYSIEWSGFGQYGTPPAGQGSTFQYAKALWDWMELLVVPLALAVIAFYFNRSERKTERAVAENREQKAVLGTYLDRMSELLLDKGLTKSKTGDDVRTVARARTLTALRRLDPARKGQLIRFLSESRLTKRDEENGESLVVLSSADLSGAELKGTPLSEIDLSGMSLREADLSGTIMAYVNLIGSDLLNANLSGARFEGVDLERAHLALGYLRGADLTDANLSGANLTGAELSGAYLSGSDLTRANLRSADLRKAWLGNDQASADDPNANLTNADLRGANLTGAAVTDKQLAAARSLQGAIMPDGRRHD